jgi:hypothetical protein
VTTAHQRRRIERLTAEIAKIEANQYRYVQVLGNDPDAQIYALQSKKRLLVRSIVIENHLLIEDAIDDLLRIEVAKRNKRKKQNEITPHIARQFFNSTFREAQAFMEGGSSIGFARKTTLARMLKLIDKRLFNDLVALNKLRNRCGHVSALREIDPEKRSKGGAPRDTLTFNGRNLFIPEVLLEFMEKYNDVFLHLAEKATGMKLR